VLDLDLGVVLSVALLLGARGRRLGLRRGLGLGRSLARGLRGARRRRLGLVRLGGGRRALGRGRRLRRGRLGGRLGARGRGAARRRGGGDLRRGRDVDLDAGARERAEDRLQPLGVVDGGLLARGAEALGVDATVRAAAPQQLLQGGVL